jgi:hypothetical protein
MGGGISKHSDDASFQAEATTTTSEQQPMRHQEEPQQQPEKEKEVSKCPMHNKDGRGYNFSLTQMFRAISVHGPKGSKPLSEEERAKAMANNNGGGSGGGGGGCPVKHAPSSSYSSDGGGGGCPVKARHQEYNVYSQPIDKMNNMPKGAKTQLPNPSQQIELPTDRVSSTIPKGGDGVETTWTYPSPQQFYNALSRKGKMDNTNNRSSGGGESSEVAASEEDMTSVVALHNNMNEKTCAKHTMKRRLQNC